MKQKVEIDYSKISEEILSSKLDYNFINEFNDSFTNLNIPNKDNVTSKDFISYCTRYIENHDLNLTQIEFLYNQYIDNFKTLRLLDILDIEQSKLYVLWHCDAQIDLSNKKVQDILKTQKVNFLTPLGIKSIKLCLPALTLSNYPIIHSCETKYLQDSYNFLKQHGINNVKFTYDSLSLLSNDINTFKSFIDNNSDSIIDGSINECIFKCNYISEIDESLFPLCDNIYFEIGSKENPFCTKMNLLQYIMISKKLNDIVSDIPKDLSKEQKFKKIYTRLAYKLSYDHDAAQDNTEYAEKNYDNSRNLINALFLGKCVCAGFAETLTQACSLVDINCKFVVSKCIQDNTAHVYNLVQLDDGQWRNADLTSDIKYIRNNLPVLYALKSDEDFQKGLPDGFQNYHLPHDNQPKCLSSIELYPENLHNRKKAYNKPSIFSRLKYLFVRKKTNINIIPLPERTNRKRKNNSLFDYYSNMDNFTQKTPTNLNNTSKDISTNIDYKER